MSASLGIYPSQILINAYKDAHVSVPIVFVNNGDTTAQASISLRPIRSSSKQDGSVEFYSEKTAPKETSDFLNNVTVEVQGQKTDSVTLLPRETVKGMITFDASTDTPTDHYFSVVLALTPEKATGKDTVVSLQPAVASNILVALNQKEGSSGRIVEFKTNSFTLGGKQIFTISVANAGKSYATVSGSVSVYDFFGKKVETIPVKESVLLSGDERNLASSRNPNTPYISWNGGFLMGYYTVKSNLLLDKATPITAEAHFLAIPLGVIVVITVIFILILGVLLRVLRKLNLKET